jgi:hypothetical protein
MCLDEKAGAFGLRKSVRPANFAGLPAQASVLPMPRESYAAEPLVPTSEVRV